jgi:hypothetical protein
MIHETNPIIRLVHKLRMDNKLPVDKTTNFPKCPLDDKPCAHYDGPCCNNFNCGVENKDGISKNR